MLQGVTLVTGSIWPDLVRQLILIHSVSCCVQPGAVPDVDAADAEWEDAGKRSWSWCVPVAGCVLMSLDAKPLYLQ